MSRTALHVVLGVAVLFAACSNPKAFDRPKAEAVLTAAHPVVGVLEYDSLGVLQCLQNMGYLHVSAMFALVNVDLTPAGTTLIKNVDATSPQMGVYHVAITPRVSIPVKVESITGISDPSGDTSGSTKIVDLTASIDFPHAADVPERARTCLDAAGGRPFAAPAIFRLYDDGWRLQSFTLPTFHAPVLTSTGPRRGLGHVLAGLLGHGAEAAPAQSVTFEGEHS